MAVMTRAVLSLILLALLLMPAALQAQTAADKSTTIVCGSKAGERQTCDANTSGGVTLVKALGTAACELGRTWGYDASGVWVSDGCGGEFAVAVKASSKFGRYTPMVGLTVADTDHGALTIRLFTYLRYLNQSGSDPTYTNAFGKTSDVQQRRDLQLNKMQIYFQGWLMNPKFRYLAYVWTSNSSLGTTAQVVVAGNLRYAFDDHLTVGAGITSLPGTRSISGNFPFWLAVDTRLIADEFFRPSYTTAVWAEGNIAKGLSYNATLGNNLSQFGIDAGQLDPGMDTFSGELAWTTGDFGRPFGDYQSHSNVATRVAGHYTRSDESRQGQPNNDAFDNVQLRVSDGSVVFAPNLFAPDVQIENATYRMFSVDAGVKYRGFSIEAEHFRRRIDNFQVRGTGTLPIKELNDTGFQVQASAMAMPSRLQIYAGASKVYGEYGDPSDFRVGATYFPWKNEVVRWNFEYIHLNRSPVGALSLPYNVGSNGGVFHTNFMVWF
jgi:hypothetical protein